MEVPQHRLLGQRLFVRESLSKVLDELCTRAYHQLMDWDPDDFLATPEADVIATLLQTARLECPTLRRSEAYLLEHTEVDQPSDGGSGGRVTEFTLIVPFDGDRRVFDMWAKQPASTPPIAGVGNKELWLFCQPGSRGATGVKDDFNAQLKWIEALLSRNKRDIDEYFQYLWTGIPVWVADRRAKILVDRELHANIGFPVRRRQDAAAYAVPLRRRQVIPRHTSGTRAAQPFSPEPALNADDYEAALRVLINMRNALERSPSTTELLTEPGIRDLLLVSLNAQFEGKAAGEVFNGEGKTDILIRVDDRNVFIAECKIWRGHQTVTDALDQLLGYLVWRDTKAALLLFIRDADATDVTAKAIAQIKGHPNYKRPGKIASHERHDFVVHANGDPNREIHLAFLPFLIARRKQPRQTQPPM